MIVGERKEEVRTEEETKWREYTGHEEYRLDKWKSRSKRKGLLTRRENEGMGNISREKRNSAKVVAYSA